MKYNLRKLSIIVIEMIFILGLFFSYNFGYLDSSKANTYAQTEKLFGIKISGTYENITIDNLPGSWNDWSWAESQVWCSGLGTLANPYVIQGHTLELVNFGVGIRISNSHDIHFIIENCTFIWGGGMQMGSDTGILLINSTMGMINNNSFNGANAGLTVNLCEDLIITNNIINPNYGGITLIQSNSTEISDNIVYSAENAIYLYDSENNIINNNTAYSSEYGIYVSNCENNDIIGNNVNDNNIAGIYLASSDYHNITGNSASGNDYGIHLEDNCMYNTISGNNANNNNDYGIYIYNNCDYNTISNNTVNDNIYSGISLEYECIGSIISGNTVKNSTNYGIYLYDDCGYTTISNNFVNASRDLGISLHWYSQNNTIRDNIVNYNGDIGIELYDYCENNTVSNNVVSYNGLNGIGIYDFSDSNILTENFLYNNTIGVYIDNGDNNSIYENFFAKNYKHAFDDGIDNKWNNTIIGNYWDNYTSPDLSPVDGIVDNPYTSIDGPAGSVDYLPIAEDGAPRITINSPSEGERFVSTTPTYNVEIKDVYVVEMWYTLDGGLNNYSFTENGTINQAAWDALPDGNIILTFYASDLVGNEAFEKVIVIKGVSPGGLDPGIIVAIVVSIAGGLIVIGVAYIYLKKRN